jgi:hypothetical protein
MALLVWHKTKWRATRADFLKRLVVMAHVRKSKQVVPSPSAGAAGQEGSGHEDGAVAAGGTSDQILEYQTLKPYAVYFAMIDGLYNVMLKVRNVVHEILTVHAQYVLIQI